MLCYYENNVKPKVPLVEKEMLAYAINFSCLDDILFVCFEVMKIKEEKNSLGHVENLFGVSILRLGVACEMKMNLIKYL